MNDTEGAFVQLLNFGGEGPRVGVKDSIDIAGYPTRLGSAVFADSPPASRHAVVVQSLLDRGCYLVGKTNMHELAYGVTGVNGWSGTPLNPRFPDRVPGGSSSGSAVAVAAKRVDFAIGTDTGGSIRVPAACCGIYGLKPTYGRISRIGVHPATSTLDCVGPFANDLDTLERAMTFMDSSFVPAMAARSVRIGVLRVTMDAHVEARFRGALQAADLATIPLELASFLDAFAAGMTLIAAENWAALSQWVDHPALGADVRARLRAASQVSAEAVAAAEATRVRFQAEVDALLEQVDALALPTLPCLPLTLGEAGDAAASLRTTALVRPFNLSGHPAMTIPLRVAETVSVGMQLVGRQRGDAELISIARHVVERLPNFA